MHDGKLADALVVFQNELKTSPDSEEANLGAGVVLDLMLRGPEARKYFEKAIAPRPMTRNAPAANRAMAMSWAFEGNCQMTVQSEQKVLDYAKAKDDLIRGGRSRRRRGASLPRRQRCRDGVIWYKEGHELGLKEPNITEAQKDLWNFRWEHAQARAAVRIKEEDDPKQHVAAAKAILDKGTNPQQVQFFLTSPVTWLSTSRTTRQLSRICSRRIRTIRSSNA